MYRGSYTLIAPWTRNAENTEVSGSRCVLTIIAERAPVRIAEKVCSSAISSRFDMTDAELRLSRKAEGAYPYAFLRAYARSDRDQVINAKPAELPVQEEASARRGWSCRLN
jgi:hypothetical protein